MNGFSRSLTCVVKLWQFKRGAGTYQPSIFSAAYLADHDGFAVPQPDNLHRSVRMIMRVHRIGSTKLSLTGPGRQYLEALTPLLPEPDEAKAMIALSVSRGDGSMPS